MKLLRWKGELADGEIHMTAREYCEHRTKEDHEQKRQALRKIANNPILTKDTQEAIRYAIYCLDDNEFMRKRIEELQEEIKNVMKARKNEYESISGF